MDSRKLKQVFGTGSSVSLSAHPLERGQFAKLFYQKKNSVGTSLRGNQRFRFEAVRDILSCIPAFFFYLKMPSLFILLLLTNPLYAQKPTYTFAATSITAITFDPKDCKHFDDTGVGCSTAILTFGKMMAQRQILPETIIVQFNLGGNWEMSVMYHPKQCSFLGRGSDNELIRFRCKNVSWRLAK